MMLLSLTDFIGRFHPVLVHLPIGILLIGLLLQWLSAEEKYRISQEVIKIVLLCGLFSAIISCITGYMLSLNGNYDENLVAWHMWMGMAVAACSLLLVFKVMKQQLDSTHRIASIALLGIIIITGHLGGSLTHGSDYLSAAWNDNDSVSNRPPKIIEHVQEAKVYEDLVQPLLQTRCYNCHGPQRHKGGLRLDGPQWLLKGGKDGAVVQSGNAKQSELIKRLLLPREDEHHMPPKDKPQLTDRQVAVLQWWIDEGMDFTKKVKELPQPDPVKPALLSMQGASTAGRESIPSTPVEAADPQAVKALEAKGVVVIPLAQNTHYLMASFVSSPNFSDSDMHLLLPLQKQLVYLKIGRTRITDASMQTIQKFSRLIQLDLDHTSITNKGVALLSVLTGLQWLNLVGTNTSASGLLALKSLKKLQSVYLYQTKINAEGYSQLKKVFPKTSLDTGGYTVPYFANDTTVKK
ncbi:MAG: c-type cytochrome domain-containing protein [Flavisolibacter sp.]